jgi:hypothetical protein
MISITPAYVSQPVPVRSLGAVAIAVLPVEDAPSQAGCRDAARCRSDLTQGVERYKHLTVDNSETLTEG